MCNCKQEIRENLKSSDESITCVYFDLDNIYELKEGKKIDIAKTGQRIEIYYTHTKRDGSKVKKERKSFVGHDFCPWCGERYIPLN